jgi:hypothetical protein
MKNSIRAADDPDEPSAASPRLAVFGEYGSAASPSFICLGICLLGIALASKRVLHQPVSGGDGRVGRRGRASHEASIRKEIEPARRKWADATIASERENLERCVWTCGRICTRFLASAT